MTETKQQNLLRKIDLFQIDASDTLFAKKAWGYIYPHAETALCSFYDHPYVRELTKSIPQFNKFVLVGKQINYWDTLFVGGFDSFYIESASKVIRIHKKFGISLPDYVYSYGIILGEFEKIIHSNCRDDACLVEYLSGLRKVFLTDIAIVCGLYDEITEQDYSTDKSRSWRSFSFKTG